MWGRTDEGFANLPEMKDLLFVMTRLQIRIFEYPKWGDVVCAETYFTDEGRLAFRREWRLTEARSGRLLGVATSTWVTINAAARRLAKLPDDQRNRFLRFAAPNTAAVLPVEETKRKLPDMDLPGKHQAPTQVARRSDMDMNGHINNASYLAWALESVPADVHEHYRLREIEIDFKAECHAGNTVEAHANPLAEDGQPLPPAEAAANGAATNGAAANGSPSPSPDALFLHVLQKCDDSGCAELVRARTTWRRA
ncbi:hypothetical protein HYH03_015144 [Edaphochlamys debaryana]|uniref:Acyl-[acyl-carrier-protein] hydrolase n=1 Tax=Edaphochlamys debaryana TaxID=47281 RepID=A0A835XLR3_9CHLO|nr:hypothetical protein HYH03_015144 [Edaphochlamys debaryana]|eukprot:KAG2486181.1 hypothetical protein HYH03_015144 [Edaphochlamys debaryana]